MTTIPAIHISILFFLFSTLTRRQLGFFQNQEVEVARIVSTTHFKSVTKWQTLYVVETL